MREGGDIEHAFWIRNGLTHDASTSVELAVAAEVGGWDGVFVSDAVTEAHSDPFPLLAAMAVRTDRITLGTWVVPLVARDVVTVARQATLVDQLADGRFVLGLGLGNAIEHDGLGVDRERLGDRHEAALAVLDALLRGDTVTRHDEWFDLHEVELPERPRRGRRPPIALAASWPARRPVRRAARWDGIMPQWEGLYGGDAEARDAELRELLAEYRSAGGDGLVLVPRFGEPDPSFVETCSELGATWMLHCDDLDVDAVRRGPRR